MKHRNWQQRKYISPINIKRQPTSLITKKKSNEIFLAQSVWYKKWCASEYTVILFLKVQWLPPFGGQQIIHFKSLNTYPSPNHTILFRDLF